MALVKSQVFERHFTLFWLCLCLPLLFLPKINLVSYGGRETAGLRIDDLTLIVFMAVFFWAHFALKIRMGTVEKWLFATVAFSIFSFCLNVFFMQLGLIHVSANALYAVRLLEYFLFFYIGMMSAEIFSLDSLIKAFTLWNGAIIILQKLGLVGEFSMYGYNASATYRSPGICSFPSEAGALLNLLFCYLIYASGKGGRLMSFWPVHVRQFLKSASLYLLFIPFAVWTTITGSRIAIAALAFCFLWHLLKKMSWKTPVTIAVTIAFIAVAGGAMTALIYNNKDMIERSAGLISWKNVELMEQVWDSIPIDKDPIGNENVSKQGSDESWWIRIHKWCYALKVYTSYPISYLQGVGPGFAMAGLDGGFLRIFVENGLIGTYLFFKLFQSIWRLSAQLKWILIALAINMIFFDVYLAYKPMSFLFLIAGYTSALQNNPKTRFYDNCTPIPSD